MEQEPLDCSQCGTHLVIFLEHHVAAPVVDYLWLPAPWLHKCSIALVPLISVKKYVVTGKRGTFYLQARKTKRIPSLTGGPVALSGNWTSHERCMSLGACLHVKGWQSKLVICRLWPLCCTEHSHGPAVVPAAAPGILACGDLKRPEKAAEMSHIHKISAQQVFCLTFSLLAVLYVLHEPLCTITYPTSSPSFLYISCDCLCTS